MSTLTLQCRLALSSPTIMTITYGGKRMQSLLSQSAKVELVYAGCGDEAWWLGQAARGERRETDP
jgi:hypothetical protein